MKLWVKNTILAVILVLIIAVPLLFMGGHEFGGSDDQASDAISELDESYEPWFEPFWEPPSGEIESLFSSSGRSGRRSCRLCTWQSNS